MGKSSGRSQYLVGLKFPLTAIKEYKCDLGRRGRVTNKRAGYQTLVLCKEQQALLTSEPPANRPLVHMCTPVLAIPPGVIFHCDSNQAPLQEREREAAALHPQTP